MLELKPLMLQRVVAKAEALENMRCDGLILRVANDEVLILGRLETLADPHAIVIEESSLVGSWLSIEETSSLLKRHCEWQPPAERPYFAQGAIAGIACKLYLEAERSLLLLPVAFAVDFLEHLS